MNGEVFNYQLFQEYIADNDTDKKEMAEEMGVSERSINQWLSGDRAPKYAHISDIADYYGVDRSVFVLVRG